MLKKETIHPDRDTADVLVAIHGETYDYHEGNMTVWSNVSTAVMLQIVTSMNHEAIR
jgi:hypothetical protein